MFLKRRVAVLLALVLAVCLISVAGNRDDEYKSASADVSYRQQIILDAGHGGLTNTID